jgi:hypothetical protein
VPFSLSLTFRVHELAQTFHERMQSSAKLKNYPENRGHFWITTLRD